MLLQGLEEDCADEDNIKEAFELTPPGSKLRELMIEELVSGLESGSVECRELDMFDGLVGFASILAEKMTIVSAERPGNVLCRVPGRGDDGVWYESLVWKKYMVGSGPVQHWVHASEPLAEEATEPKVA